MADPSLLRGVRAVVFDAVGTVIHPEPRAPVVYAEAARRFGSKRTVDEITPRFIAAFVAGLAVQFGFREVGTHSVEFTEEWGQVFNLSVFFLFGVLAARAWSGFASAWAAMAPSDHPSR